MRMPFFHTHSIQTRIAIRDGATVLFGDGTPTRDGKKIVYSFVTARLIGLDGKSLHPLGKEVTQEKKP